MLMVTPHASEAIQAILSNTSMPPSHAGLRIVPGAPADGATASDVPLQLEVASQPADEDEVVVEGGANVYLEETVAPILDDKILDAQTDQEGKVRFVLSPQEGEEPMPT
jgi:iron-sulfur cluster assembly protein